MRTIELRANLKVNFNYDVIFCEIQTSELLHIDVGRLNILAYWHSEKEILL